MAATYAKGRLAEKFGRNAILSTAFFSILCIIVGLVFFVRLPRSLTRPIEKLKTGIRNILIIGISIILLGTLVFFIRYKILNSYIK